ncbi:titin homolog isoform X1 [Astyanax mexicanus]|uniref:titin homolog isoform X1 n=1 Tax=Astyanax mexicanus TaxID=7994 RepID=UPI0020CB690C|nr:titin homolog isoform X1 [Astyanax mexicanus]
MTEGKPISKSSSVLHSMLIKLKANEKVHSSSRQTSKFYTYTNDTDQNEGEDTAASPKLESTFEEQNNLDTTAKADSAESTDRNAADEDSETFTLESQLHKSSPVIYSRVERRKRASDLLTKEVEEDPSSNKSQPELEKVTEESELKEDISGSSSPLNESQPIKRLASFNRERKTEDPEPSNKDIHASKQSLGTISSKALENPNCKETRSASDPVKMSKRNNRTLSDPGRHYRADMDQLTTDLEQVNSTTQQMTVIKAESPGTPETTEGDSLKVKKKKKNIAQKLKAKFREKSSHDKSRGTSSFYCDEDITQSDISIEEAESPTPKEENSTKMKLMLNRTCTLRDFKLNLEPISLMDELFTGDEWTKFLPVKEKQIQEETTDQSQTESSCQSNETQSDNSVIIQNHQPSEDKNQSQSEADQTSVSDRALDEVREVQPRPTPNKPIYAVHKSLISNGAVKQKKCELPQYEHSTDDDVYDFVEVYMLPKNNAVVKDLPLDLPDIESIGVLDNSALKNRINLNKNRKHRPPKKKKKETSDMRRTSTFYTPVVDNSTNMDVPRLRSYSTSSSYPPRKTVTTSPSSSYKNSVFYPVLKPTPSCDTDVSPAADDEKQKAKEKSEKPKLWKVKN